MHSYLLAGVFMLATFAGAAASKPGLLYSRHFNAKGETRYLPDGNYKEILDLARKDFAVVAHDRPLSRENLKNVKVVLIANPSASAISNFPPPNHIEGQQREVLNWFVENGGGLILMGNQEDHNLETNKVNAWIRNFGIQFQEKYTDAKQVVFPKTLPAIGGLRLAYYTGNLLAPAGSGSHLVFGVTNNVADKPVKGTRNQEGLLLAGLRTGKGRIVLVTDAGWITTTALNGEGIGGVAIKEHDNGEIFLRLARWAAGEIK